MADYFQPEANLMQFNHFFFFSFPQEYPHLTTFFDGEIIGEKHPFLTRKWVRDNFCMSEELMKCIKFSYLSNIPHFLWVYRRDNPRGMLREHEKSL